MALDLKQNRHGIGRTPNDHFKDLTNVLQDHSISAHSKGLYLSREARATPKQLTVRSMGTSDHTLQGTAIFSGARQPRTRANGENVKSNAGKIESVDAIYQQSKAHQHQDPQRRDQQRHCQGGVDPTSFGDEEPPTPPPKDTPIQSEEDSSDPEYASSSSRPDSAYTFTRQTFTEQLAELTALSLPQASSLTSSISDNQTAAAAVKALSGAAGQLQGWIENATEILGELDAEDDVEWAAAGGRGGLEGVENVAAAFEELVGMYVAAIDELQSREDISAVPREELETVVEQMERTMTDWEIARNVVKGIKEQVELAMEWEELWGVVLGDIGQEVDALNKIVFEMEEKRHRIPKTEKSEQANGFDIAELETIVEETQVGGGDLTNHRFSLPPAFAASSPTNAPGSISAEDDSVLMGLFARMQPLRASLDFLPMTLSGFQARAKSTFPTACRELESRRLKLEMKWVTLGKDAETLRCELGEDRWVVVFRNAGRQATKMCESVERSVDKLQEAIDTGAQHSNPPALAKKVDNYEAKKMHYGPAIQRVLAIIEKGVKDRLTVNGEILKLRAEMQSRWSALEASMRNMDVSLDDLNLKKSQQLRDSLSSIISMDRSAGGSAYDTPRSSPASSVVMGPSSGNKAEPLTPGAKANSRRGSFMNSTAARPGTAKRYFSMPSGPAGSSSIPQKTTTPRSSMSSNYATPPSGLKHSSTPLTPTTRSPRPTTTTIDGRPRWISSGNMNGTVVGHNSKSLSLTTPSPHRRTINPLSRPPSSASKSSIPLPSPLSRVDTTSLKSTLPTAGSALPRAVRRLSGTPSHSSLALLDSKPSSSPADTHTSRNSVDSSTRPKLNNKVSASFSYSSPTPINTRRQSATVTLTEAGRALNQKGDGQAAAPDAKTARPSTAMAAGRRSSMLPVPKVRAVSGRDSAMGTLQVSGADVLPPLLTKHPDHDPRQQKRLTADGHEAATPTRSPLRQINTPPTNPPTMPLGIQRLNARHQQPNARIVFIKPLAGPDQALAQDFLERIAAISQPIMKTHHLSIMTLEEHEPNAEFVGRNFNAGEVIQLVLKAPFTGRWLPFRSVQMVMMHELAHCVQMNHSGAFWKVRDAFAGELRALWARGYSGDGFWSRGKTVLSGEYERSGGGVVEEVLPKSLCGGTFRSRRGKRKRTGEKKKVERLTYAERQQRRIARKFGTNGVALGDDVEARVKLEEGKRPKGKPRVAGSARGRELRAAAALARFGQQKEEDVKKEEEQGSGSETESEYEEVKVKEEAVDMDGSKMLDGNGQALVRVCEDEDKSSVEVQREMKELQELSRHVDPEPPPIKQEDESTASENEAVSQPSRNTTSNSKFTCPKTEDSDRPTQSPPAASKAPTTNNNTRSPMTTDQEAHVACPICSLTNHPASPTCSACAHVLNPSQMPNHWRCSGPTCSEGLYVNAGDCGICGVCGTKRAAFVGD